MSQGPVKSQNHQMGEKTDGIKSEANNTDYGASFRGTVALGKIKAEEVAVSMENAKRPEQSTVWDGTIEGQI